MYLLSNLTQGLDKHSNLEVTLSLDTLDVVLLSNGSGFLHSTWKGF